MHLCSLRAIAEESDVKNQPRGKHTTALNTLHISMSETGIMTVFDPIDLCVSLHIRGMKKRLQSRDVM